jgi:hypothetical protein
MDSVFTGHVEIQTRCLMRLLVPGLMTPRRADSRIRESLMSRRRSRQRHRLDRPVSGHELSRTVRSDDRRDGTGPEGFWPLCRGTIRTYFVRDQPTRNLEGQQTQIRLEAHFGRLADFISYLPPHLGCPEERIVETAVDFRTPVDAVFFTSLPRRCLTVRGWVRRSMSRSQARSRPDRDRPRFPAPFEIEIIRSRWAWPDLSNTEPGG